MLECGGVGFAILRGLELSRPQAKTHYVKRSSLWFASFVKYNMQFRSRLNSRDNRGKKKKSCHPEMKIKLFLRSIIMNDSFLKEDSQLCDKGITIKCTFPIKHFP